MEGRVGEPTMQRGLQRGPPSPPAHACSVTPSSPIPGPLLLSSPPFPSSPPPHPPHAAARGSCSASTPSPARAADSAHLHTDLRPGSGLHFLGLAKTRSPLARRPGSSGSWFRTGAGSGRYRDRTAGRAPGLQPTWAPAGHVNHASPEFSPGPAPLTPIPEGPSQGRPECGCGGNGGVTERAGRGGFLTAGALFTWRTSSPRPAVL